MTYVLLADICYDINGGEYCHHTNDTLLSIKDFDTVDSANERAIELLSELSDEDYSILLSDSDVKSIPLENYMEKLS